jgi:hypothetical protein
MTNQWRTLTGGIPERSIQAEYERSRYYTCQEEPIEVHTPLQNIGYSVTNILIFLAFFLGILFLSGLLLSQIDLQKMLAPSEFSALSQTVVPGAEAGLQDVPAAPVERTTPQPSKRRGGK